MAVIRVKLIGAKGGNARGGQSDAKHREYDVYYRVETNDTSDGPKVVYTADDGTTALPAIFSTYSLGNDTDTAALLTTRMPREEGEDSKSWIVHDHYTTDIFPHESLSSPLNDAPRESASFDHFTTIARQTLDAGSGRAGAGMPLLNSAGQAFSPPPEVDQPRPVYIVRKNQAFIDLPFTIDMINSVNQAVWKGCGPRTVLCRAVTTGEKQQRNGIEYFETTYEFHLNDLTWDLRILNQSTLANDSAFPATTLFKLVDPEPVTIFLKTNQIVPVGTVVSQDAYPAENAGTTNPIYSGASSTQVYLRYRYYKERNFNLFPF